MIQNISALTYSASRFKSLLRFITLAIFLVSPITFSQEVSIDEIEKAEPKAGTLYLTSQHSTAQEAINLQTDIQMSISGLSARVKVTQIFENESDQWVEGKYLFPLPDKAAVDHLTMKIGDRLVIGEIKEKQEAQKIYQRAKLSGRKASLVEQQRPNLFTNSVANIGPYEKIEIIIEYQQEVIYESDQSFSIRFPMTITPRYQPASIYQEEFASVSGLNSSSNSNLNSKINGGMFQHASSVKQLFPTDLDEAENTLVNRATINIELDAGFALLNLNSSSHKLNKTQKTESQYQIKFAKEIVKTDRDFILNWKPVPSMQPRVAIFSETLLIENKLTENKLTENKLIENKLAKNNQQENYISMMLLPPSTSKINPSLMQSNDENIINREVIFVIDTSGSMAGESMKQAIDALKFALSTLQQGDKFNVIEFNSTTSKLFDHAENANRANLEIAEKYVTQLEADGGTEMFSAMEASLDGKEHHQLVRQVIFLTDGAIGNEAQLFSLIDERLGDSRLYTVGIGSAPNTFFMKKAALFGRGTFTFIADVNESKTKMQQLFKQISRPQLTHINIDWPDNIQADVWPKKIPDLYDGEPLWIKAKVTKASGMVNISGRVGDTVWQTSLTMDGANQQSGVAVLWAREKIESIMNSVNHGLVNDEQKQEIIDTAIKHHIVSRYTSLIAVDKTPTRIAEELRQKMIKNHTPKGSQKRTQNQLALNYPNTSLDLDISLRWFGMFFMLSLIGLIYLRVSR